MFKNTHGNCRFSCMFLKLCKLYLFHVHFSWLQCDFLVSSLLLYIQVTITFFRLGTLEAVHVFGRIFGLFLFLGFF